MATAAMVAALAHGESAAADDDDEEDDDDVSETLPDSSDEVDDAMSSAPSTPTAGASCAEPSGVMVEVAVVSRGRLMRTTLASESAA